MSNSLAHSQYTPNHIPQSYVSPTYTLNSPGAKWSKKKNNELELNCYALAKEVERLRVFEKNAQSISNDRDKDIEGVKEKVIELNEAYKNQFGVLKGRLVVFYHYRISKDVFNIGKWSSINYFWQR